jgi:hypothetical protein
MISDTVDCFKALESKTSELVKSIKGSSLPFWIPDNGKPELQGLTGACSLISGFWYQDGQEGRETMSGYGLVCVDHSQLSLIEEINELKDQFKYLSKTLEIQDKSAWLAAKSSLKPTLRDSTLSRIHLKQTWRHIPCLEESPHKVTFNWYSSGRSIKKITTKEAIEKLLNMGEENQHIQVQLDQANKLPESTRLAIVQKQAPLMRANIVYRSRIDGKVVSRKATNAAMPMFILSDHLPKHNSPQAEPPIERSRAKRSDQSLSDEPYLPSIRAHLYV